MTTERSVVVISDTHNYHGTIGFLPMADIIVHCGDFSTAGTFREFLDFIHWYSGLTQFTHKILIAGNHDLIMEKGASWKKKKTNIKLRNMCVDICRQLGVHYLQDELVQVMGLRIYGSPHSPKYGDWGFPLNTIEDEVKVFSHIPKNLDILVTHCPPRGILDVGGRDWEHLGSVGLQEAVMKKKPRVHLVGHIHESFGETVFNDIRFINAAYCSIPYSKFNEPVRFTIDVK